MKNWTIGRRIITSFTIMLFITMALGGFALWQILTLNNRISDLSENILPSVFILNEVNELTYSNFNTVLKMSKASPEELPDLEKKITANKTRIEDLYNKYITSLVADPEDGRIIMESSRLHKILVEHRSHWFELLHENKA
jgi:methyl-accepting chemotaxis protein